MAIQTGSTANGEKMLSIATTVDQAERGGHPLPEKRGTGISIFGPRKRSFPRPDTLPVPVKSEITPTARPAANRTASSASLLTLTPTSNPPPVKSHITLLCLAVTVGDKEVANAAMDRLQKDKILVSAGFTAQDPSGNGLLQIAALHGHHEMSENLLNRGININAVDRNHGTALQAAIYMGQKVIYRQLLDWENPPSVSEEPSNDSTNNQIKVNTKGGYFGCALQVAAYKGNVELVKELLSSKYEADVNICGGKYGSPLQAAVRTGRMSIVRPILQKADVNFKGGKYGSALQAVARGPYRTRTYLPEISRGQVLKQSAQNSLGQYIDREDSDAKQTDYVEVATALFQNGARMDGRIGMLDNPINAAACSGSEEMLKLMLINFDNRSPEWTEAKSLVLTKALLTAITKAPENQEILARLLVRNGASIQYETSAILPNLPLEAAATKGLLGVVNFLLETRDNDGQYANTLSESGIHGTALRAAIAASKPDKEDVAVCLITRIAEQWDVKERSPTDERSVKMDDRPEAIDNGPIRRKTDDNALDWTQWDAEYGNLVQLATVSGLKRTVSLLLQYGADPNVRDTSQRTALHIAAWFGFPQIVRLLLAKGADVTAKDEWGATPLDQAEESLDRDGHPGATEQDLQDIVQTLRASMGEPDNEKPGTEFRGPKRTSAADQIPKGGAKPVFAMPFWIPGVGFRATIVDIWESELQEFLLLKKPRIEEILYHKAVLDSIMTSKSKPGTVQNKLRWVHIPTNNMTWAEMIIASLCKGQNMPTYKSLWGADPFYTSPDLSPHARFIAPQCGRLVPDRPNAPKPDLKSNPLFMAMPYIHWESYIAQTTVSGMIESVKNESLKTDSPPKNKLPLWPSEKADSITTPGLQIIDPTGQALHEELKALEIDHANLDNPDSEEDYLELLRRYLYKRRPVHLRRTLDQYYYSYLADTNVRDSDQVVMRQFNEDRKSLKLEADRKYKALLDTKNKLELEELESSPEAENSTRKISNSGSPYARTRKPTIWKRAMRRFLASGQKKKLKEVEGKLHNVDQKNYYDDNSPVLMIDQLWLWVIDEQTIVTCFPHRQFDRNSEDLDAADKTDILKTIVSYLHSSRRPEINTSQALAELIISQCVGVLHKADMIPELDFLKKYSVQSNKWADQVMQMLSKFVKDFEEFMIWIKDQPAESEESIRRFESIFSVTEETRLLRNIQDIKDELGMLKAVFDDQIQVLKAASEEFENADYQCEHGCHVNRTNLLQSFRCPHSSVALVDQSSKHLKHVERMQVQANQAYGTLKDLLDLKQQQAYVLEARVSRNEAISSGIQSKTIMVFTIVTIIFLPLTFVTTIFTLPIAEFQRVVLPEGSDFPPTAFLKQSYVQRYIIAITFAVAVPLILAAFKIQSLINGWKRLRLKMEESKRLKKVRQLRDEDDGMPEFLKGRERG